MKRPQFMGFFRSHPVFRFGSWAALRRLFPAAGRFQSGPFEAGLYVAVAGLIAPIPVGFSQIDWLDAACSTPRLARAIRASDQAWAMRGAA